MNATLPEALSIGTITNIFLSSFKDDIQTRSLRTSRTCLGGRESFNEVILLLIFSLTVVTQRRKNFSFFL